jgi:hypothetical protein
MKGFCSCRLMVRPVALQAINGEFDSPQERQSCPCSLVVEPDVLSVKTRVRFSLGTPKTVCGFESTYRGYMLF